MRCGNRNTLSAPLNKTISKRNRKCSVPPQRLTHREVVKRFDIRELILLTQLKKTGQTKVATSL